MITLSWDIIDDIKSKGFGGKFSNWVEEAYRRDMMSNDALLLELDKATELVKSLEERRRMLDQEILDAKDQVQLISNKIAELNLTKEDRFAIYKPELVECKKILYANPEYTDGRVRAWNNAHPNLAMTKKDFIELLNRVEEL